MNKILVFGGTFNPVHNGHVYMCREIADQIKADKTLIIPTYSPVHKTVDKLTGCDHRINMCKLAFDLPTESVCTIEIDKGRPCYTYETLSWLKASYPDSELYLACGSDMFLTLHTWKNPEIIFDLATVCAVSRKNDIDRLKEYSNKYHSMGLKSIVIDCQPVIISSTEIRDRLKLGENVDNHLSPKVASYIRKNGLYL